MSGLKSHNEFDSLETFFNTRLKDASLEPTDNSWMLIEEELNRLAKEKRRRRFFWFFSSGLLLVCGLASLWYLMPEKVSGKQLAVNGKQPVKVENKKPEVVSQKSEVGSQGSEIKKEEVAVSGEKAVEAENEKTENISNQKIQLGAFKHIANVNAFNKIPYKIIAVKSNDGYTKYYAESNEKGALEKIQKAGFAGAFVKKNFDESLEKSVVKNEGVNSIEQLAVSGKQQVIVGRRQSDVNNTKQQEATAGGSEQSVVNNPRNEEGKEKREARSETKDNANDKTKPVFVKVTEPAKENPVKENSVLVSEAKSENTAPVALTDTKEEEPTKENQTAKTNITNTEPETKKQETTVAETKKESTPVKEERKDSIPGPVKTVDADSGKKSIFTPVWSIAILGGPNFFSSNSQSATVKTLNEHQQLTYNGELQMQYRPIKLLSISGGVNFTTFTAKQDATYFRFNKYQTSDYLFHSSFGDMAVPMSDMLQGFWFNAPTDTFFSKYSYTTTIQTINIPLQANVHFLNTKWINLSLGIGVNNSYAIGEQTHFSLIKENSTLNYTYNQVNANKFNLLLMASLGCDIRITKHWSFTVNPSYKYGITNMSKVSGTTYKPAFLSANAGMKFTF
ncbi:MAG: outer membrane beta-barrel protein [Bacteroidia bacterium]